MSKEIPIVLNPYFEQSVELDGGVYQVRLRYSTRGESGIGSWYIDFIGVLYGIKVVNGIDILKPYKYRDDLPPGKLGGVRKTGKESKPVFNNFGIEKEITLSYEPVNG